MSSTTFQQVPSSFESSVRNDKFFNDEESEISKWLKLESDLPMPSVPSSTATSTSASSGVPTFTTFNQAPSMPSNYAPSFAEYSYSSSSAPFPFVNQGAQYANNSTQYPGPFTAGGQYLPFVPQYPSGSPSTASAMYPFQQAQQANPFFPAQGPFANVNLGALALLPGLFGSQPALAQMTPAQLYQLLSQFQSVFKNGMLVGDLSHYDGNSSVPTSSPASPSSHEMPSAVSSPVHSPVPSPALTAPSVNNERKRKQPSPASPSSSAAPSARSANTSTTANASTAANGSSAGAAAGNGMPKRVRQTRPKVVESKGAVQCKGRNRKKGIQCRNAALMEYIGPRPIYCAEHIEQDPLSLYEKCKSSYQKEVGDAKGCKEVVLKEFGYCYKHYHDLVNEILRSNDFEKAYRHQVRINELVIQLEKEAAAAKKKDGDLYQRKNKLIPKFHEMKKIIAQVMQTFGQEAQLSTETQQHQQAVMQAVDNSPSVSPFGLDAASPSSADVSSPSSAHSSDSEEDFCSDSGIHFQNQDASDELPEEISPQITSIHDELQHHRFQQLASSVDSSFDDDLSSDSFSSSGEFNGCYSHHGHQSQPNQSQQHSHHDDHLAMCSRSEVELVNDTVDFVAAVDGHGVGLLGSF